MKFNRFVNVNEGFVRNYLSNNEEMVGSQGTITEVK